MTLPNLARRVRKWCIFVPASSLVLFGALWYSYVTTDPDYRNQAMVRSVGAGNIALVRHYLATGADPNTVMRYIDEPLESRGISPHAILLRIRGGPGAPVTRYGPTALMMAVERSNLQMVQLLLEHGADVNKRGWYEDTALSEAKDNHDLQMIHILERAGARK